MRHLKSGRSLGVSPSHRKALLRNMVCSVLEHGRISTTVTRAKEARKLLESLITLGKKGDLSARRAARKDVNSKPAMKALFEELPELYSKRQGGYSRIIRAGNRRGDGAQMAFLILVDHAKDPFSKEEAS